MREDLKRYLRSKEGETCEKMAPYNAKGQYAFFHSRQAIIFARKCDDAEKEYHDSELVYRFFEVEELYDTNELERISLGNS